MNNLCNPDSKAANLILDWYDTNARQLAWRTGPGKTRLGHCPDPYSVWLSEIMLQQTQVKTVHAYYMKFIHLWPSVKDLADAPLEDILKAWAGLGYYSRARNLKKCANIIDKDYDGRFPSDSDELRKLPGIGNYTSAAIRAIAFGIPDAVVDGNVERVITRIRAISEPVSQAKQEIRKITGQLMSQKRPGDFAQAMMDLGATICTPRNPSCTVCPWRANCRAQLEYDPLDFPVKAPRKTLPKRNGAAFVAITRNGEILLRRRPDTGILAGMSEVPCSDWSAQRNGETSSKAAPFSTDWQPLGFVTHSFTHFHLEMKVYYCLLDDRVNVDGRWIAKEAVMSEALPNLMKKVIAKVLEKSEENQWLMKSDI